uniref:7TM GPCR serpentine receptor class x (Srx) domain-containing protein n=1 Tax=Ditylenchus dipsaci TaxID=166011 RepID=A0A915EJF5_9BILA
MIPPWIYALLFFSTTIDISPIYNSVWSVYLFNIDYRDGAPAVADWVCFWNCAWVIFVLLILYSLLLYRLKKKSGKYQTKNGRTSRMQKHVMLQSFLICFFMFCVAFTYTLCGFVQLPKNMTKIATISLQMCSGFTSIVYLVINKEIRKGVKLLLFGKSSVDAYASKSSKALNLANVTKTQ